MCRSCADGGRRCPTTETTRQAGRAAASRYYQRGKARRKIAELADAGIPAVGDDDMPATYHQHTPDKPVTLDSDRPLTNPSRAAIDKPNGALWASPGRIDAEGNIKTAWTDWAAREDFGDGGQIVEVKAAPGAVIVTLDTRRDADALMVKYGTEDMDGRRSFDWAAMRADGIDGVHVSDRMARLYGYTSTPGADGAASNFAGWSAGSVAWISSERLEVGEPQDPGTYSYVDAGEDEDAGYREVAPEEGEGEYDEPARPDPETAWDRVPNRFKTDHDTAPEPTDGGSGGGAQPYQYGRGQDGVKVPAGMNLLDIGTSLLAAAVPLREGKGRKKAAGRR